MQYLNTDSVFLGAWQGWPIFPPLDFREEATSPKLVEIGFCEVRPVDEVLIRRILGSSR
jgi:hypothetical protein